MSTTSGNIAFGTELWYVPRSGARTRIGEIANIDGVEVGAESEELTNHESTDRYREFRQGLRDAGAISVTANHVAGDDGQAVVASHFHADTRGGRKYMEIVFPDGWGLHCDAVCTAWRPGDAPVDGKIEFSAGYKLSGKPHSGFRATGLTTPFFVLSEGNDTVSPARASGTYAYTASVANGVTSLTITPTSAAGDSIYVQGEAVDSGDASSAITLAVGANVLTVVVYQDGKLPARYQITVTRAAE